ncbi:FAD-dependent monooxygenase [Zobellella maritima]|uniref:FAD-dependent monooxygenase n=1 Tax=Zobellella maritima TaxID=2059725 RepID=UPI000E3025D5|nr:FAD-dependent monooxygenase [Zobellella maritima]
MQAVDVIIIGGGLVGLTLALALKDTGLTAAVIEGQMPDGHVPEIPDNRVSAINLASQTLLERLGAWPGQGERLGPYSEMEVWEADSFGRIHFSAQEVQQPRLGHIVENNLLQQSLLAAARASGHIRLHMPARASKMAAGEQGVFVLLEDGTPITGRLLVGADGARSSVREQLNPGLVEWDYDHAALVATINTAEPHDQTARQIFRGQEILAFLPLADAHQCSIVWSCPPERAEELTRMDDAAFNKALSHAFDLRMGLCRVLGPRQSIPLRARYSKQFCGPRWALVGDAAHTVHPLAGQGVNLGLLDAAALAETLGKTQAKGGDIGQYDQLKRFERWRKAEAATLLAAMEALKRLFGVRLPLAPVIRGLGLGITNSLPQVKRVFAEHALGTSGQLPGLCQPEKN